MSERSKSASDLFQEPRSPAYSSAQNYIAALIATLLGAVLVLTALEDWDLLRRPDPVLETSTRTVLWAAAVIHVGVSVGVFFNRSRFTQASLLLWLGLNHIAYRVGLAWLNASLPLVVLRVIGMKVGIHARVLDVMWQFFMAYLVVGSVVVLVAEWRRGQRLRDAEFLAQWAKRAEKPQKSKED